MNMHSWPSVMSGVHSNGPTIFSALLFGATFAAASWAVVIGFKSFGQTSPAAGLAWKPCTTTLVACCVPRFLIFT